jgi:hypothetical protein
MMNEQQEGDSVPRGRQSGVSRTVGFVSGNGIVFNRTGEKGLFTIPDAEAAGS